MERITEKQLQAVVDRINRAMNMPLQPYELQLADGDVPSKYIAQIGCYHLSHAYGGVALHRIYNDAGGVDGIFGGHMPKRELYGKMHAFLTGLYSASAPDLLAERDRLREVNAELVAALQQITIVASADTASVAARMSKAGSIARAALAKAQAE